MMMRALEQTQLEGGNEEVERASITRLVEVGVGSPDNQETEEDPVKGAT